MFHAPIWIWVISVKPWYLYCFCLYSLYNVSLPSSTTLYLWIGSWHIYIYTHTHTHTTSSWTHNLSGHPHEDIIVGTTRGQAAFSLTKIALCQREKLDNKMMYCCTLQRPIVCYGTFKLCKTNCYSHNRKWPTAHPVNGA